MRWTHRAGSSPARLEVDTPEHAWVVRHVRGEVDTPDWNGHAGQLTRRKMCWYANKEETCQVVDMEVNVPGPGTGGVHSGT